jgi:hypothetical protein
MTNGNAIQMLATIKTFEFPDIPLKKWNVQHNILYRNKNQHKVYLTNKHLFIGQCVKSHDPLHRQTIELIINKAIDWIVNQAITSKIN